MTALNTLTKEIKDTLTALSANADEIIQNIVDNGITINNVDVLDATLTSLSSKAHDASVLLSNFKLDAIDFTKKYDQKIVVKPGDIATVVDFAIINHRVISLGYVDRNKQFTEREIEPLTLGKNNATIFAWDLLHDDYRQFNLANVRHAKITSKTFVPRTETF